MNDFDQKYPEHAKLRAIQAESQKMSEILNYLKNTENIYMFRRMKGTVKDTMVPVNEPIRELLAGYCSIDIDALDKEKELILHDLKIMSELRDETMQTTVATPAAHKVNVRQEMIDAVAEISYRLPNAVFCGSFGLMLHGKLDRDIDDLDVIVSGSDDLEILRVANYVEGRSKKFEVNGEIVHCNGAIICKTDVDFFVSNAPTKWVQMEFEGLMIKVQTFEEILIYKEAIAKGDDERSKHRGDLKHLGTFPASATDAVDDLPF